MSGSNIQCDKWNQPTHEMPNILYRQTPCRFLPHKNDVTSTIFSNHPLLLRLKTNSQPLHDPFETRKHTKKMEKKRGGGGALERTSQIVSDPYYFLHFMAFFSYLPIRASAAPHTSHRLFDRELQAFLAFLMFSAIKVWSFRIWSN